MAIVGKDALRFTRVKLKNWRNFTEVDVKLQQRVFVIGPNAAGKSNFLDVFRFLRDIASHGGGFHEAVSTKRGGVSKLRCLAARRYPDISIYVSVGSGTNPTAWEYELQFTQDNRQRPKIKFERVLKNEQEVFRRPDKDDEGDPERLTETYLEQVSANQGFRELAEFFASVQYLHVVPQLVRDPEGYVGKGRDLFGANFLEQIARTSERTLTSRLRKIREALRVAVPQLKELEFYRDRARGTPHLRGKYEHWRPQGAWQTEEQFSDGTLRLLGLLWVALDTGGPLLLEEPELSLHLEVIRFIAPMFARMQARTGRQIILSTHSAELLSDESIALDEILLIAPSAEGAEIRQANSIQEIRRLLKGGVPLPEVVFPRTKPKDAAQLPLFAD